MVNVIEGQVPHVHETSQPTVGRVQNRPDAWRKERLANFVRKPELLTTEQTEEVHTFLGQHHSVFCLEEQE